jgi:cytochrome c oxidase subunit 2
MTIRSIFGKFNKEQGINLIMSGATRLKRVLIASANPLFRDGLQKVYVKKWGSTAELVGITASVDETMSALEELKPDLVIVDHDDTAISRSEFLDRFVAGKSSIKVVLVSLNEAGQVVVYDRRQMTSEQAEEWFQDPWEEEKVFEEHIKRARKSQMMRNNLKHFIIVGIFTVLLSIVVYMGLTEAKLLPIAAAVQAGPIDRLFRLELVAISFLFSLIVVPLIYSLVVFRRKTGDTGDGQHFEGNTRLEIFWTVIPLFVVLGLAYLGAENLAEVTRADPEAMEAKVTGFQWAWRFDYPEVGVTSNELHLVVDRQVVLRMSSPDVIHSFWVPEFRIKQDLVPGIETAYRITPSELGTYKVRCAELCGTSHSYMESPVIVQTQDEFDAWIKEQVKANAAAEASGVPDATRGQRLYESSGCKACHSIDGSSLVGPTWKGLWGEGVELEDGTKLSADDAYIFESIREPNAKIVKGFAPGMPKFNLSDRQIADLIEFIKSLK